MNGYVFFVMRKCENRKKKKKKIEGEREDK